MDRLLNYMFLLLLILAIVFGDSGQMWHAIIWAIPAAVGCGLLAFALHWLTLRGATAASIVGMVTFGLGGWAVALSLLSFFVSSVLISVPDYNKEDQSVRRDGLQVWANGFWLCIWLVVGALTHQPVFWMMAVAAVAVAAADTWATELGSRRFDTRTYDLLSRKLVPSGTQGGVSTPGLAASLLGSAVIALLFCIGFSIGFGWFLAVTAAGFIGGLVDSCLGAGWQGKTYQINRFKSERQVTIRIDNDLVNWLSTGSGPLLILIFKLIFL